jgi:hypothetical protein
MKFAYSEQSQSFQMLLKRNISALPDILALSGRLQMKPRCLPLKNLSFLQSTSLHLQIGKQNKGKSVRKIYK